MSCVLSQMRLRLLFDGPDAEEGEGFQPDSQDEEDHLSIISLDTDSEREDENAAAGITSGDGHTPKLNSELEVTIVGNDRSYYLGRDGQTIWNKTPPDPNELILSSDTPFWGVMPEAQIRKTPVECWQLFFSEEMLQTAVAYTNLKINEILSKSRSNMIHPYMRKTSAKEINALIGLLYLSGIFKSTEENLKDLWRTDGTGVAIFHSTMSYQRFCFLQNCLRFDSIDTRNERAQIDKLAPIGDIFYEFVENCKTAYAPSDCCIIGERLDKFTGHCSFRQYMPSNPPKFGIKSFVLVDAKTCYTVNMEIYTGTPPNGPYKVSNEPYSVIERLIEPIWGTNRNVTFDKKFGSYHTVLNILNEYKLTVVCALKNNKAEIPSEFLDTRREIYSNMFGFQNDVSMVSYVPKRGKNIVLLSTLHHDSRIDPSTVEENKSEIVSFYNSTKKGLEKMNQLCSHFDVSASSKRWSLTVFYSLLNIAGINSAIVYRNNNLESDINTTKEFLRQLGVDLVKDFLKERKEDSRIFRTIRNRMAVNVNSENPRPFKLKRPARCDECPRSRDRKTKYVCETCNKRLCLEHIKIFCEQCSSYPDPGECCEPTFDFQ